MSVTILPGDCLASLAALPEASVDSIVTDPPYHLASIVARFGGEAAAEAGEGSDGLFRRASRGFMGKEWDGGDIAFRPELWRACLRVLKPGGHLAAFNHSRTFDRMAGAIRLAGFEIRDSILELYSAGRAWREFLDGLAPDQAKALARALAASDGPLLAWLYGTGFPKSHDLAKGIDRALGAEGGFGGAKSAEHARQIASGAAKWGEVNEGWRRPWMDDPAAVERTARDYLPATAEARGFAGWGTALKPAFEPILLARKPLAEGSVARQALATGTGAINVGACRVPWPEGDREAAEIGGARLERSAANGARAVYGSFAGRRPGGFAEPGAPKGDPVPNGVTNPAGRWPANVVSDGSAEVLARLPADASGSVARFFYSAKAGAADRKGSAHPTVKPAALMRWLLRLVTPAGGVALDPFAGSGATGWAAAAEGFGAILCEREPEYLADLRRNAARLEGRIGAAEAGWRAEIEALAAAADAEGRAAEAERLRARLPLPHPDDLAREAEAGRPSAIGDLFG